MLYGIEQTTDMRYPGTKIVKHASKKSALAWLHAAQDFAWVGAAKGDIPVQQQNWHHRLRSLYKCERFRPSSLEKRIKKASEISTPTYRRTANDVLAGGIMSAGWRVEE